jgi:hypothetical protein
MIIPNTWKNVPNHQPEGNFTGFDPSPVFTAGLVHRCQPLRRPKSPGRDGKKGDDHG